MIVDHSKLSSSILKRMHFNKKFICTSNNVCLLKFICSSGEVSRLQKSQRADEIFPDETN
jgi:hypothetical protein